MVVADEHPLILTGFRSAFADHKEIQVLAECADRTALFQAIHDYLPDVIALDAELYRGTETQPDPLVEQFPTIPVLLLSSGNDQSFCKEVMRAGIRGVVAKQKTTAHLEKALRIVRTGGLWFDRSVTEKVATDMVQERLTGKAAGRETPPLPTLSAREREIVLLVSQGLRNKEIAARLFISEATVSHHFTSVFRKLGVEDRVSLVIYAFRNGLAQP